MYKNVKISVSTKQIGAKGEQLAVKYLQTKGYIIRGTNIQLGHNEIDILAFDPQQNALVFVEVKTLGRRYVPESHPANNFTSKKKQRTIQAARKWVYLNKYEEGYRVDLVCIVGSIVVEHLQEVNGEC